MPAVGRRRLIGLLVLLGAVAAVWLLWKRPNPLLARESVHALFADADGLAPVGADVRVAGVPVGRVTGVSRDGSHALVSMSVDASAGVVRRDATATLRPRLMFEGTAYVQLTLGSPAAPALGDGVLPVVQTSTYVPFADVLSVLTPRFRGDLRAGVATAGALSRGAAPAQLHDVLGAAPALTSDVALIARAAQGPSGVELGRAVASLSHVASAAASQSPALSSMLGTVTATARAASVDGGAPLDQALGSLPSTVALLRSGASAAASVVHSASPLVGELQRSASAVKPTIDRIRPLLVSALPVLAAFGPVLRDAEVAVRGAAGGASPALGAINALTPTLDIYNNTLLSALEAKTDLGDPAYLAFLGLFAGGGGASRPFGIDGQGHFMRFGLRFLTGVGLPLPPCTLLQQVSPTLATLLEGIGGCTP